MNLRVGSTALLLAAVSLTCSANAQNSQSYLNDTGSPAYSVKIPVENGFIDVSNGNLHLEFPLASPPQRGALSVSEKLVYDSRIWMYSPFGGNGSYHWWPYNIPGSVAGDSTRAGGWRFVTSGEVGSISYGPSHQVSSVCGIDRSGGDDLPQGAHYPNLYRHSTTATISWSDPAGSTHPINATTYTTTSECDPTQDSSGVAGGFASDGSGYSIPSDQAGNVRVIDGNGTQVWPTIIDRYGNYLSQDSDGNLIDDTGRIPVITSHDPQNPNVIYYDVLSPNGPITNNGTRVRYSVTIASVPVYTTFENSAFSHIYAWHSQDYLQPVQTIKLPDGTQYSFAYNSNGEVSTVSLPTGGAVSYGYTDFIDSAQTENSWLTSWSQGSNQTTITPRTGSQCANYSSGCVEYVTVHRPSGDETLYELTLANGAWNTAVSVYNGVVPTFNGPRVPRQPPSSTNLLSHAWHTYQYSNACSGVNCVGANYVTGSVDSILLFNNTTNGINVQHTQSSSTFDPTSGKPTALNEWDYVSQSNPSDWYNPLSQYPSRQTSTTYIGFDKQQVSILDNAGAQAGLTTYSYTSNAQGTSGIAQHGSTNAGGPYLQAASHWLNSSTTPAATTYLMDDSGMVVGTSDPLSQPSTINYQCANSLPSVIGNALNQSTIYTFDCSSGAILSVKDDNDNAAGRAGTTYSYDSLAGRLQTVTRSDLGQTSYSYVSAQETDITTTANPDPAITSKSIVDSFGRPSARILGGVETDTDYDTNGRLRCTSNPYTTTTTGSTCFTAYDGLDRPLTLLLQDGVATRTWSYTANSATATDEKRASWTRVRDAFGRLQSVQEPNGAITSYGYDGLGNVSAMSQVGGQSGEINRFRSFTHDSLSRLTCIANPETSSHTNGASVPNVCPANPTYGYPSGVITYEYDLAGNIVAKTDARGIKTSMTYDGLNRLKSKSVTAGSATTSLADQYFYDGAVAAGASPAFEGTSPNSIGRLSFTRAFNPLIVQACTSSTRQCDDQYFGYDEVGRLKHTASAPPSKWGIAAPDVIDAKYNRNGGLIDLLYPDGLHVNQAWDNTGRLLTVGSTSSSGTVHPQAYLQPTTYNPDGTTNVLTLGNGVQQTWTENIRQQFQTTSVSTPLPPLNQHAFLSKTYCYSNCPTGGTDNTGSIWGIADNLNAGNTQGFTHDVLNRISSFSVGGSIRQQYTVDSFGNATIPAVYGGAPYAALADRNNHLYQPCADPVNPPAGSLSSAYDPSGNQLCDFDMNQATRLYAYDEESRVSQIALLNTLPFATYSYAADGRRMRTDGNDGTWKEYTYLGGQLLMEKDQAGVTTDYIYANGEKLAQVSQAGQTLHTKGTFTGNWNEIAWNVPLPTNSAGQSYPVQSGDQLCFRQYTNHAIGGLGIWFSNGQWTPWQWVDSNGATLNQSESQGTWANRCTDLSWNGSTVGSTITGMQILTDVTTPAGDWDIWYSDMSILSTDGTVTPINLAGVVGSAWGSSAAANYVASSIGAVLDGGPEGASTHYYLGDHLGTAQLEISDGGWPVWQGQFGPYGQELDRQRTLNTFKFAGLERDGVTALDQADFRTYNYTVGRWLSADPYDGSMNIENPQSLNRYAYVTNSPTAFNDLSGLDGGAGGGGGIGAGCIPAIATGFADVPNDIWCGLNLILDAFRLNTFFRSPFGESTRPRPGGIWNEHGGYKVHPFSIAGDALGINQNGCEFGACSFQQGSVRNNGNTIPSSLSLPYLDYFDSNHRLSNTHYCGPGGGGRVMNGLDEACRRHDNCYAQFDVAANVNMPGHHTGLSPSQVTGLAMCNQALYDQAGAVIWTSGARAVRAWLKYGFGLLYPGTEAQ